MASDVLTIPTPSERVLAFDSSLLLFWFVVCLEWKFGDESDDECLVLPSFLDLFFVLPLFEMGNGFSPIIVTDEMEDDEVGSLLLRNFRKRK